MKNTLRTPLLFLTMLATAFVAAGQGNAQNQGFVDPGHLTCDQYDMTQAMFAAHPERIPDAQAAQAELEDFTRSYAQSHAQAKDDEIIIIPVVFHVVHLNGEENISDEQIHSAIDVLNEDYSAQTEGIDGVVADFADIVGNVGFEFRLARRDPDGNCTNGIDRVYSNETLDGSANSLKQEISTWGRSKYLNVWVVKAIGSGAAGFAYLPSAVNVGGWGQKNDGIVILHDYVGSIGTSSPSRSHALSHEVGHWANLNHTWGNSNSPGDPDNCNMDDNVNDTPETIGWQSCNLNGSTCGTLDNVENFMDYSYCYKMFTLGQKTRMRAALSSNTAQRSNLHTEANLIQTGVLEDDQICLADFKTMGYPEVCAGAVLDFEDLSYHNPTEWFWTFEGGEPSFSEEENPSVAYTTPGVYNVSLTVSNANNGETVDKQGFVTVLPIAMHELPVAEDFEEVANLDGSQGWLDQNPDNGDIHWELNDAVGFTDNSSVYVEGIVNTQNAIEVLTSPTYDLSNLIDDPVVTFKYAHARRTNQSDDLLRVYVSKDCGSNWDLRNIIPMSQLPTVEDNVYAEFVPESSADWKEVTVPFIPSLYFTDQFRLKFEFTSYKGNNLYLDDINITGVTGVEAAAEITRLQLYPNPTRGETNLEFDLENATSLHVDLLDLTGRNVLPITSQLRASGNQRISFSTTSLADGMYLLRIRTDQGTRVERLVVD